MSARDELEILRGDAGIVDRSDRAAVLVAGPDAISFLQVLVSADLDPVGDGAGVESLLLTPQGKVTSMFRLLRVGDDAWLDADAGTGTELASSLDRFRIRVKAEVTDRSGGWSLVSVIGPDAHAAFPVDLPPALQAHVPVDGARAVRTEWGFDVVGPPDAVAGVTAQLTAAGLPAVGPVAYDGWRIEHGIPVQPIDVDDRTIPQEAFLDERAVSFTKGCFVGQELVCRIDTRGHVNRFLRRVVGLVGGTPDSGAEIVVDDKVVGTLTSVAAPELGVGALGYVRREVEPPRECRLSWAGGSATATVVAA